MTFLFDAANAQDEDEPREERHADRGTALWSRRGLSHAAIGWVGWLLVLPLLWLTRYSSLSASYLGLPVWLGALLLAVLVSTAAVLIALVRRSWGVALVSLALAAVGVVAAPRPVSSAEYIDHRYRTHRAALAALAQDYRSGHLNGTLTLPAEVREICPSGFAYADPTALFVQLWQNWRAESGTGLAYFGRPPAPGTNIQTAEGDQGQPQREVGDGWWWIA